MKRLSGFLKALLTLGKDDQAFLGARWTLVLLRLAPSSLKRRLALWILSLSPHYFYRNAENQDLPLGRFLEAEFERNRTSREKICDQVLRPYLKTDGVVLDIGCGGGFLARAVAPHVRKIYACDISTGVLECARILNSAPNIEYTYSGESGFDRIPNGGVNLIYSFAVIQHVRENVIRYLFDVAAKKLCTGGHCLFQVQLENEKWRKEEEWTGDASLTGRLRLKYALNFFPRSLSFFQELAAENGLNVAETRPLREILDRPFDDIYYQDLIALTKL